MKQYRTYGLIISVIGIVLLGFLVINNQRQAAQKQREIFNDSQAITQLNMEKSQLQDENTKRQEELNAANTPAVQIILTFEYSDRNLYEKIFPLLDSYGFKGNFQLATNTLWQGRTDLITLEEFKEMQDAGWDYAITDGANSSDSLDYNGEKADLWQSVLSTELDNLKGQNIAAPTTYIANTKEAGSILPLELEEQGFEVLQLAGDGTLACLSSKVNLASIDTTLLSMNQGVTAIQTEIDKAVNENRSLIIQTKRIINPCFDKVNVSTRKYTLMLDYLKNLESTGALEIVTYSEFYENEINRYEKAVSLQADYDQWLIEYNAQMAELDEKVQTIMNKH